MTRPAEPDAARVAIDRAMLDRAARAALRAQGRTSPNPIVGCVIGAASGEVIATARHERFGGPHAEVNAIAACRARGIDPRGMTAWVTLEPCNHRGKTGPCSRALIDAGIAEVVYATPDPSPIAAGGARTLADAGVRVRAAAASRLAIEVGRPFVHRKRTGRPWIIAKWAQTIDGRIATRTGASQWISGERARRDVHRLRGRSDAIITGIGTVRADNPRLTVRGVVARRQPLAVVIDPDARTPTDAAIVTTERALPPIIVTRDVSQTDGADEGAFAARVRALRDAGVTLLHAPVGAAPNTLDLAATLAVLSGRFDVATAMVEAGPGLMGGLFGAGLIDEAWVYVAPMVLGDAEALPPAAVGERPALADATTLDLVRMTRMDRDVRLIYRRAEPDA